VVALDEADVLRKCLGVNTMLETMMLVHDEDVGEDIVFVRFWN
jgi:hypothetical protein